MKPKNLLRIGVVILGAGVTGCTQYPEPFNPESLREIQRSRAREVEPVEMRPLPTTRQTEYVYPDSGEKPLSGNFSPTTRPSGRVVPLSLQEVIHRTVVHNSEVRVAAYQTGQDNARVLEAEARFDPILFSNVQFQRTVQVIEDPLNPRSTEQLTATLGIRANLPNGGEAKIQAVQSRNLSDNISVLAFNPYYQNELQFQLTQPLLQNFGTDVNRARITIARNDQRIGLLDFRQKLEEQVAKAEEAYWQLVQAQGEVQIQERLLNATRTTAWTLLQRWGQDVARVQLSQANSAVEDRKLSLIQAHAQVRTLSLNLKRLMSDPDFPVSSGQTVQATDIPVQTPIQFNLEDQVDTALNNRLELLQQEIRIQSADTVLRAAGNNLLPQLNLVGQVGLQGLAEDYGGTYSSIGRRDYFTSAIGFQFEMPIGNRPARAIWLRTQLQRLQAIEGYRSIIDQVSLEVTTGVENVKNTWDLLNQARRARFASAEALEAIRDRERAERALDPTFVQLKLDRESALAQAERTELEALVRYNIAVSALERAKGTLLRYNNVAIEEERLPGMP